MASSMEVPPRDLQKAVRQLLSSVISPTNGSQSKVLSLEDAVANLETTDENFHRYEILTVKIGHTHRTRPKHVVCIR